MPCIWGRHNGSQAILPVAIFDDGISGQILSSGPDRALGRNIFNALIDTGAQATCISRRVAERIDLLPIGRVPVLGVSGLQYHSNYLFKVGFVLGTVQEPADVTTVHIFEKIIDGVEFGASGARFDVLLGMDVIAAGSLKIDGDGSFSFSF
jgi:hypothetical protein